MRKCELCESLAKIYCESDQASLCLDCDAKVHGANFLVAKHSRTLLCHLCQSLTPWTACGHKLTPTVSVCENCVNNSSCREERSNEDNQDSNNEEDDDDLDGEDDEDDDENGGSDDGGDQDDQENQVVPWSSSMASPPVLSSSNSEECFYRNEGAFQSRLAFSSKLMRESTEPKPQDRLCSLSSQNNRSVYMSKESAFVGTSSSTQLKGQKKNNIDSHNGFRKAERIPEDNKSAMIFDLRKSTWST